MSKVCSLSVSIVTFQPDLDLLQKTLMSLTASLRSICNSHDNYCRLNKKILWIVDNGPGKQYKGMLETVVSKLAKEDIWDKIEIISGHGNVGYGKGHNLAIQRSTEEYHLILNPDVIIKEDAIVNCITFMQKHHDVGLLAPAVYSANGQFQYLCKNYPSVLDLFLRGFFPHRVRNLFRKRLNRYEMRDRIGSDIIYDIPIVSGAFMFFRCNVLHQISGFSDKFFLYFEDFDISIETRRVARTAYVPSVVITHMGGNAAKKGLRHIIMFIRSAIAFFSKHGWKLY